jgi:hypothetical protein
MVEHGSMPRMPEVWVIQCLQDYSNLFISPLKDEDERDNFLKSIKCPSLLSMQISTRYFQF